MTTTQIALVEYLTQNPRIAESLIDACNTITACDANGRPLKSAVSPSDFSDNEWRALVAVSNIAAE